MSSLPSAKRAELAYAVELVRAGFAKALQHRTQERFRNGRILKIVLFGSYARGDWVEDPVGRYFRDFDLLVVVNHEDLTDPSEFWGDTERALLKALTEGTRLRTPVSLIVHSLEEVNAQLRLGRYSSPTSCATGSPSMRNPTTRSSPLSRAPPPPGRDPGALRRVVRER